ncbi:hypothetical protein P175DRAFT_0534178 [Aspergillus ochraceoroseus IBT 24754]|uniref:Dipeptidylpeptidase IV N-terminal domain-containing protein n=3 Tax=Aspergillus subgen. Nidulantes TaxID=2720870 RepID=A0A0F8WQM9_9EURO|nr:uncharacterized protein P175DRAFT_0534178 [Aspergillus ochraceoroseus IBT 24754]KKK13557.1 hypothetical protein ARAM_001725 [Aspergillus rambellii]KKK15994.1 hypothetical protein AOCH_000963 [Aspergillus ochraceoroseus]PTU19720.1 hypothetical protein P175DRAFT_0534178 [Aspergillus ochraceoroseus IBT 24754]
MGGGTKRLTFNETVIATADDGDYVYQEPDGSLNIERIVTNQSRTIIPPEQVPKDAYSYRIHPDLSFVLWETNCTKQYRHCFFADYYIQDVATFESTPLIADRVGDIQYAE